MTLKKYSNRNKSTLGMFLHTIRQNMGLVILTVIVMLLICPGYIMLELNRIYENLDGKVYEFNGILIAFGVVACLASAIGVVVYNIINFMYLYSKKSSDVFHSVPLTRIGLLFSRSLAGICCTLIPLVIGYIAIFLIATTASFIVCDIKILFILLMYNIFIMLSAWVISLFFLVCAGSIFDFLLSMGVINVSLLILPFVFSAVAEETLLGYSNSLFDIFPKYISPVYFYGYSLNNFCDRAYEYTAQGNGGKFFTSNETVVIIVSVIFIALMLTACALLYRRRKAEKSETAYAFKFIYVISNVLLSFLVGFGTGSLFSEFELLSPAFWMFAIVGSLLAAAAFGAISKRSFKELKSSLIIGGISAAAIIAMVLCFAADITGFESRIPEINKIESVNADVDGFTINLSGKDCEPVRALHTKIVTDRKEANLKPDGYYGDDYTVGVSMRYKLKNGSTLCRNYYISSEYFAYELLEVCRHEDVDSYIDLVKSENPKIINFSYYDYEIDSHFEYLISKDDLLNLLDIYKKEIKNMDKTIFDNHRNYSVWFENEFEDFKGGESFDFCVGENYTEFKSAVKELSEKYEAVSDLAEYH